MRALVTDYLNHKISRRGFVNRLLALGFTAASAEAMLAPLDASEAAGPDQPDRPAAWGYSFEGTGAALVIEQAKAAGAEYLFTNPGSLEAPFFDAYVDTPGMHMIMALHEGVVISMADGYAKVSRKPAFVNVHACVGTAQMAGQLYNAGRDGSPVVVTAGLQDNEVWSDDYVLAPRPGFDEKDINRQFTKISWEARQAESLPLMLRRAFKVAATEPGGPVFLAMGGEALAAKDAKAQILPANRFLLRERMRPEPAAVEQAARMLVEARRPVLVVGDEIWKSGAQAEALALAEQLGLGVYDLRAIYSNFPEQHPQYLGRESGPTGCGMLREGFNEELTSSELARRGIDLIVMAGSRDFGGTSVPSSPEVPEGARIVRIGLDTNDMGRNYPTDLALVGDMKEALADLGAAVGSLVTNQRLAGIASARAGEVRSITSAKRKRAEALARANFGKSPIHPDELGEVTARSLDPNAIVVTENYTARHGAFCFGFRENEQMRVGNTGGSLGWGIGASIGAKLAAADRQVVCSIGDGALMYSSAGFWTQARHGIPVLTVVSNNRNYQVVRWAQDRYQGRIAASGHYPGMFLGDPDIDFVKLAESEGVSGERVTSGSDLEAALKRGIACTRDGRPYLVEVAVARYGHGADSTWHEAFNLAERSKRSA
jgi:thiamine pyrophosphate-dependent acetolactate synthase large subunit-like protein